MGELFGSLSNSMLSLYMATTGGDDWSKYYFALKTTGLIWAWVFNFFIFFFTFALVTVLTGIFVDKAVQSAAPDRDEIVRQKHENLMQEAQAFRELCSQIDKDSDGVISLEEFMKSTSDDRMIAWMASAGLEVSDVEEFYNLIAENEDLVDTKTMVEGCLSMRGTASAIDMRKQLCLTHKLQKQTVTVLKHTELILNQLAKHP